MNSLVEENTQNICEYQGNIYYVFTDMETKKDCIEVDGKKLFLNKNGEVAGRQPGGRNVKDCVNSFEDMTKIYNYLIENKKWNLYLLFVMNYNFGRRIGDILSVKWCDLFNENWKVKKFWEIKEEKTKKSIDIKINNSVKYALKVFFENETAFEKTEKTYTDYVFRQLRGTHKGKVITQSGYTKALIKIGEELKLDKRLRSHGFRRGAFTNMLESHPNDPKAKTIIMGLGNWSNEGMMTHYIGESDKQKEMYIDDLGNDFMKYVVNGEEVPFHKKVPQVVCNTSKLLECMRESAMYFIVKGMENAGETDPKAIMEIYNDAMKKVEEMLEDVAE